MIPQKKRLLRIARVFKARRECRLSHEQVEVLVDIALHPGATYEQVSGRTGINPETMRRYAMDLRNGGYLIRAVNSGNLRIVEFSISAKGAEAIAAIAAAAA